MRSWPAILAALLLGGCNMVHTDHPLFTEKDGVGAPAFRPGVWAAPDRGCEFDPNLPVKAWPSCAHGDAEPKAEPGMSLMIVAGAPLIIQYGGKGPTGTQATAPNYYYFGLEALRMDSQGRIIGMHAWPVECGPPRHRGPHDKGPRGTRHPWPGLVMDPDGDDCTTASTDAIRAAAVLSRPKGHINDDAYWVRDGEQ